MEHILVTYQPNRDQPRQAHKVNDEEHGHEVGRALAVAASNRREPPLHVEVVPVTDLPNTEAELATEPFVAPQRLEPLDERMSGPTQDQQDT